MGLSYIEGDKNLTYDALLKFVEADFTVWDERHPDVVFLFEMSTLTGIGGGSNPRGMLGTCNLAERGKVIALFVQLNEVVPEETIARWDKMKSYPDARKSVTSDYEEHRRKMAILQEEYGENVINFPDLSSWLLSRMPWRSSSDA